MASSSSEVALDFKDALQDLKANAKFEINNLTVIAKENTEHAQAISEALEAHIKETRPEWKLPALYVLDSIAKNVGTPYTVYLGRNLYRIFMDTYSLVDPPTRKAMENLFKTWKQPVPDSLDTRPVFQPQVTKEIENALLKHRTLIIQARPPPPTSQAHPAGGWPNANPTPAYRNSSTANLQFPSAASPFQQPPPAAPKLASFTPSQTHTPPPAASNQPAQPSPYSARLRERLMEVIFTASMKPQDEQTKQLLATLLRLQAMMESSAISDQQLAPIEMEVNRIRNMFTSAPPPSHGRVPSSQFHPPGGRQHRQPSPFVAPSHSYRSYNSSAVAPDPTNLAHLFRSLSPLLLPIPSKPIPKGGALMDALRAAGFVGGPSCPITGFPQQYPGVSLESNSLKTPRPDLISFLYDTKMDQCKECSRRFYATPEGKQMKARHLDWHFQVNTRLADQTKTVVSRKWFGSELEWIKYADKDEALEDVFNTNSQTENNSEGGAGGTGGTGKPAGRPYMLVPTDLAKVDAKCMICQENFKVEWHNEEEQLVWMDALAVQGKTYHASCYSDHPEEIHGREIYEYRS